MSKRIISKMASVVLCTCILLSTVFQSGVTYAVDDITNLIINQSQLNGEYALNLSQVGDVDWLHLKGDGSNNLIQITKATTPSAISFNTLFQVL